MGRVAAGRGGAGVATVAGAALAVCAALAGVGCGPAARPVEIPRAAPGGFAVAVADFEGDAGRAIKREVIAALERMEGEGVGHIEMLDVRRTIGIGESIRPGQDRAAASEEARGLLAETGASILIWGRVTTVGSGGGTPVPVLFMTTAGRRRGDRASTSYALDNRIELRLPGWFWRDLADAFRAVVAAEATVFMGVEGRYVLDRVQPFLDKAEGLLEDPAVVAAWSKDTRGAIRFALGYAWYIAGEQAGENAALGKAVEYYQAVLADWTRDRVPLDWAMTQDNLGTALATLGEREAGTGRLKQAVAAFEAALQEWTRDRVPLQWAMIQNNLGNALRPLGQRIPDPGKLCQALAAHVAAFQTVHPDASAYARLAAAGAVLDARALGADIRTCPPVPPALWAQIHAVLQQP